MNWYSTGRSMLFGVIIVTAGSFWRGVLCTVLAGAAGVLTSVEDAKKVRR